MKLETNRFCILAFALVFLYHCQIQTGGSESEESKLTDQTKIQEKKTATSPGTNEIICPIPISQGKIYGTSISKFDQTVILSELKILLSDLCERKFYHLINLIHPTKGLYVDAKGYWTIDEVKNDLIDPNGYFQVYYFDSKKLDQKKGSPGNLTVRDVFIAAKQVIVDFYVSSSEEVELKFRFEENPKLERYLINPSFIKTEGNWYLLRMF